MLSSTGTPDIPLYKAVLASSALPVFLPDVIFKNQDIYGGAIYGTQFPDKEVHLRDGGVRNNLPHLYLKGENKLILNFVDSEGCYLRPLTLTEKLENWFCGEPAFTYGQADAELSEKYYNIHYINPGVGTTDIKKAIRNFDQIKNNAAAAFKEFETANKKTKTEASIEEMQRELNVLKYVKNFRPV